MSTRQLSGALSPYRAPGQGEATKVMSFYTVYIAL